MITSKVNEKIKYINSLKNKKFRDKYNKYILEGIKLVDEHISSEGISAPEFIVLCKSLLINNVGGEKLYEKVTGSSNVIEVDEVVFKFLTDTETPQGILVVLNKKEHSMTELVRSINNGEKVVVLDSISDAGNMGTIIRTAVSFNVKNIICIRGTVDIYSSKVVRSAMGALQKLNIFYLDYSEIEMLKANTSKINVMTRKITNITTKKLTENLNAGIPVQSLAFTGIELLSGYGKIVLIKTVSVTDATCDLSSEFKSAGINQTIHSIYAIVRVNVNIELPMKKKTQTYETKVLVSEAVLVGKVPEVYLNGGLMS